MTSATGSPTNRTRPSARRSREGRRHHLETYAGRKVQVLGCEYGHYAGRGGRSGDIHRADRGMGQSRSHKGRVETPVLMNVVDEAAGACDEARVLAPADGVTED
jgi:hypothetical protein